MARLDQREHHRLERRDLPVRYLREHLDPPEHPQPVRPDLPEHPLRVRPDQLVRYLLERPDPPVPLRPEHLDPPVRHPREHPDQLARCPLGRRDPLVPLRPVRPGRLRVHRQHQTPKSNSDGGALNAPPSRFWQGRSWPCYRSYSSVLISRYSW